MLYSWQLVPGPSGEAQPAAAATIRQQLPGWLYAAAALAVELPSSAGPHPAARQLPPSPAHGRFRVSLDRSLAMLMTLQQGFCFRA